MTGLDDLRNRLTNLRSFDEVTVTVADGALRGRSVYAVICDQCGLVGSRTQRESAEALADEHLTRHGID